jgi:hypothetical protein
MSAKPTITFVSPEKLTAAKFNPSSRTEEKRLKYLKASMEEHGFLPIYPIIVNEEGVIADGHRRWTVAKLLGIDSVPVIYANSGISLSEYWALNPIAEPLTATEVLEAYTKGLTHIPRRHADMIRLLQAALGGKGELKKLFAKGKFTPAVYQLAKRFVNKIDRGDDMEFLTKTIVWIVENRMQRNLTMFIHGQIAIDMTIVEKAIEENRALSLVANIS